MRHDSFSRLGRAIESSLEAAALPLIALLGVSLLAASVASWVRPRADRGPEYQRSGGGDVVGRRQRNPFLDFHRAAEAAGYPALLIVSLVSLAPVVLSIALLAIVQATWTFAIAILSLVAAIGIVAGAVLAAFSDGEGSAVEPADGQAAPAEGTAPVPLRRAGGDSGRGEEDRKAA